MISRTCKSDTQLIRTDILKCSSSARKVPCWIAGSLFMSLRSDCSWEALQVEFAQVMGWVRADAEGELSSLLTLPAGYGIKSARLCTRRQHDSCFLWLGEKHIDSLPQLASFGKRWSVAKKHSTGAETWTVEKGQRQRGQWKGGTALNDTTSFSAVNGF